VAELGQNVTLAGGLVNDLLALGLHSHPTSGGVVFSSGCHQSILFFTQPPGDLRSKNENLTTDIG